MKGAAQYLTGWKHNNITTSFFKVTTNTYQIISKMQRQCVKDSYVGDTIHEAKKMRNQQMTSHTSMVWTYKLTSKFPSVKSMKDYNLRKQLKVHI